MIPSRPGSPTAPRSGPAGQPGVGVLGWVLLAAGLLLVLILLEVPERTILWRALFDAGHVPLFGLLSIAVLRLVRDRFPDLGDRSAAWASLGVVAALGVGTELLQNFQPNREPSLTDFARDLAGAGAFLLVAAAWPWLSGGARRPPGRRTKRVTLAVALLLLAAANVELLRTVAIVVARRAAMPTLFALDGAWWERERVKPAENSAVTPGDRPATPSGVDGPLARLDVKPAVYPGVALLEPYPDWRGYRRLTFTVVSDLDVPVTLMIRVDDALHDQRYEDRFNRSLAIAPGVNRIDIPLDEIRRAPRYREMDLSRMRAIILFAYRPRAALHLFLGPLRLE